MVNNTVYHFLVLTWGLTYFWKRGNIGKRMRWNRGLRHLCTLCIGFHENFIYTLHLCFSSDIIKWCKVFTKTDSWFQKLHDEFQSLQTNLKSKKLKLGGQLLSKNCILSAKTLYTEDLSNITFNYLPENSPTFLCHFWKYKSFFTTPLIWFVLAQTLHTFYKVAHKRASFQAFHCSH